MQKDIQQQIIEHVESEGYQPQRPRQLARALQLANDDVYDSFRGALRDLMDEGRLILGSRGSVLVPTQELGRDEIIGSYRHNRRGFGFVVPTDPSAKEDLFIPPEKHMGAMSGDLVRAKITHRGFKHGKPMAEGKVIEIMERKHTRFAGTLARTAGTWMVYPDGNAMVEPILTPDAAGKHIKPGTKVIVEITQYAEGSHAAHGVIADVLGEAGEKDVDLKSMIVQHNLPETFPDRVREQAAETARSFKPTGDENRLDLTDAVVATIDPVDAKDFDDAISLEDHGDGTMTLGVHIADVSHFVPEETPLDVEARERGNSTYFPGHVIPMLPESLSNGVCSLQEGVPRFAKSAFITLDRDARPIRTAFSNSVIKSRKRMRYVEAQAIIDGAAVVPHPEGDRTIGDYEPEVVDLLQRMDDLAKRIHKRRLAAGQLTLDMPSMELVLDEEGKVVDAVEEDQSFTHTIIEMFMVEANEAVARLLDGLEIPFIRRTHPHPEPRDEEKLRNFAGVAGHKIPANVDRHALQSLLAAVRGKPEQFAVNMAVLKSLTRAEYSPKRIGHFALASDYYCHFTSPIRRYADLTVHRLLDRLFAEYNVSFQNGPFKRPIKAPKLQLEGAPSFDDLVALGRHISFTERRSEGAERELKQVKILNLLADHVGEDFGGVVTGVSNLGLYVQLDKYMIEGLVRFEHLLDDWWEVDPKFGVVRGQHSGKTIRIGDVVKTRIIAVDLPRRDLELAVLSITARGGKAADKAETARGTKPAGKGRAKRGAKPGATPGAKPAPAATAAKKAPKRGKTGAVKRVLRSKQREKRKTNG